MNKNTSIPKILEHIDDIPKWRQSGYTQEQIAALIGVSYKSIERARKANPAISQAFKKGNEDIVLDIENNMFRMAMGKSVSRKITYKYTYDADGTEHLAEKNIIEEPIKPDTSLLVFVLTNLSANREKGIVWKNRQFESDNSILEAVKNSRKVLDKVEEALNDNTSSE